MTNPHGNIIDALERAFTDVSPTIVNENSKFVIATYWWGRDRNNNNTAKYCHSIFEEFCTQIVKNFTNIYNGNILQDHSLLDTLDEPIPYIFIEKYINPICDKYSVVFFNTLKNDIIEEINSKRLEASIKSEESRIESIHTFLTELKQQIISSIENKSSNLDNLLYNTYVYENKFSFLKLIFDNSTESKKRIKNILKIISILIYKQVKEELSEYTILLIAKNILQNKANHLLRDGMREENMIKLITNMANRKKEIKKYIKASFKVKSTNTLHDLNQDEQSVFYSILTGNSGLSGEDISILRNDNKESLNIYDILNKFFQWKLPIKYDEMITKWEKECEYNNCNYLALEVPEFAMPGGYQLAINAKPYFIQKALSVCSGRGVVYIDGDMYIRKYPNIFDTQNVDFMARGWWFDPRSSCRCLESVMVDPYIFETSGGIMFFADTKQSKKLLNYWISDTQAPRNEGKADDRILSLTFNARKMLLEMSTIQLPIEYLWLTLDYSPRALEQLYDWDFVTCKSTIMIEHPECLTTEDTATGAGASNDRQPKYYDFIEDLTPISELLHEDVLLQDDTMTDEFKPYLNYMKHECYYINDMDYPDKNPFVDNGLIRPSGYGSIESKIHNKKPFTVISKKDTYKGEFEYNGETKEISQIQNTNTELIEKIEENIRSSGQEESKFDNDSNDVIHLSSDHIEDNVLINEPLKRNLIPRIIAHLKENKDVIWYPSGLDFSSVSMDENTGFDFVFTPIYKDIYETIADHYKVAIDLKQPIMFLRPYKGIQGKGSLEETSFIKNSVLIKFLMMHENLEQLSNTLYNGSYQFISRLRIKFIKYVEPPEAERRPTISNLRPWHLPPNSVEERVFEQERGAEQIQMPIGTMIPDGNPVNEMRTIMENRYLDDQELDDQELDDLADEEVARATELGRSITEPPPPPSTTGAVENFEDEDDDQTFEELGSRSGLVGGRTPSPMNSPLTISRSKTPEFRSKTPELRRDNFVLKIKQYINDIEMKNIIEEAFDIYTERKENEISRIEAQESELPQK